MHLEQPAFLRDPSLSVGDDEDRATRCVLTAAPDLCGGSTVEPFQPPSAGAAQR